jgi:RecA/RadA recombinase
LSVSPGKTKKEYNPYDFANPVFNKAMFAGRKSEISDIRYYLAHAAAAPRAINIAITGSRSSGKTSLLNRAAAEASEQGIIVARVDLNEGDAQPLPLLSKLYDAVLLASMEAGAFAGMGGRTYAEYRSVMDAGTPSDHLVSEHLFFPAHIAALRESGRPPSDNLLQRDLCRIQSEAAAPIAILFDECNVLTKSRIELEILRNTFMNMPGYMLIFSGTPELFPVLDDVFSPIVRQFKRVDLKPFQNIDDTEECIASPLREIGKAPQHFVQNYKITINEIHRITSGRPYEIQLICHFAFRRVQEGLASKLALSTDVLDDVVRELESRQPVGARIGISGLGQLSPEECAGLAVILRFPGTLTQHSTISALRDDPPFSEDQIRASLSGLEQTGLIAYHNGCPMLQGDDFDDIYVRYYLAGRGVRVFRSAENFRDALGYTLLLTLFDHSLSKMSRLSPDPDAAKHEIESALASVAQTEAGTGVPDLAYDLYDYILTTGQSKELLFSHISLKANGEEATAWIGLHDATKKQYIENAFEDLLSRCRTIGASLVITHLSLTLADPQFITQQYHQLTSSPKAAEKLAKSYYNAGFECYKTGDATRAHNLFSEAFFLEERPDRAVCIAYTSLISQVYQDAEEWCLTALSISVEGEESWLLANYDLAVCYLATSRIEEATSLLNDLSRYSETPPAHTKAWLLIPARDHSGEVLFREESGIDVAEAVTKALEIVSLP